MDNTSKLHYRYNMAYLTIILLAIIICLITVKWGTIADLEKLLSFGLTLTSLFLALIAIIFAIFSNFSFSKSAISLQDASMKISGTTKELHSATNDIKEEIKKIPPSIEGLGTSFEKGQKELLDKLSKQEELKQSATTVLPSKGQSIQERFLAKSSYTGLIILYACKISKETSIPFKLEELKLDRDYSYGFLIACNAMDLVSYTLKNDIFTITKIDNVISDGIDRAIIHRRNEIAEENPEWADYKEKEEERITKLKDYFKEK